MALTYIASPRPKYSVIIFTFIMVTCLYVIMEDNLFVSFQAIEEGIP